MGTRSGRKAFIAILLGAFVLRAGIGGLLQKRLDGQSGRSFLIEGDAYGYWELGRRIATGAKYEIYDPPRAVLRMPGFPAFLAFSMTLAGENLYAARILLAALGTLACLLVYCLGQQLFDDTTGLIAAGFTAVVPTLAGFSVLILSETLFAVCLLACLLLMAKLVQTGFDPAFRKREICLSLTVGVAVAAACYVRPSWLLTGPFFAAALVVTADTKKRACLHAVLVLVGLAVAMSPWTIRNYRVTGHPVVTTLWVGPSLYDGLNPDATGGSNMEFFDNDRVMDRMSEYDMDRHYRKKSWEFVLANPWRTVELAAIKFGRFWKPWPNAEQFAGWAGRFAVGVFFVPMILFAVRGWWACRDNFWAWGLTLGPILYFSIVHMVFVASLRYRLPAEYPLCILSAAGFQSWWQKRSSTRSSTTGKTG